MALEDAKTEVDTAFTRTTQRGYAFENAFGGATSFLRRSYTKDLTGVDLAITGVPFDQAVTHRPGTRFGPRAIREASSLMPYDPPYGWPTNPLADLNIIDYGDCAFAYAAAMLRDLAGINLVGGDVVEVSPPYDTTGATAIAGAHVAYELICLYHRARTQR